ncbi:MAG: hypothetical protein ACI9P3_003976 [Bradyrhizobium sp.]|jgi:hypothetical protein
MAGLDPAMHLSKDVDFSMDAPGEPRMTCSGAL